MPITLHMEPLTPPMSWEAFRQRTGPFSVALDGYVEDGPQQDFGLGGPKQNLNHHAGVYRPATRATCAQVLVEVRDGFYERFRDGDGPRADVHMNDCDEDVGTSVTILKHPHLAETTMNPLLNRLVSVEDMLDTFAGAYPFPKDLPVLRELAWVFDPYRRFRLSGGLERKRASEYLGVVEDVGTRILAHLTGHGSTIALDFRYEVLRRGDGWVMVRELGAQARTAMLADGIRVFVSVRERPDGARTLAIGKFKSSTSGDLGAVIAACNTAESDPVEDRWGGGTNIMGSPRVAGTRLDDQTIAAIMDLHFGRHVREATS